VQTTLGQRIVFPAVAGLLALALTACGSTGGGSSTLRDRYLPGTTSKTWTPLINVPNSERPRLRTTPVGLSEWLMAQQVRGKSSDEFVSVSIYEFRSATLASGYYHHPLVGFPLVGPTGVPSPSRNVDFRTLCTSTSGVPNLKSYCSDGVGTLALRSNIVVIGSWIMTPTNRSQANTSELPTVARYVKSALTLLSRVGVPS
jgi:hypothetical protein